MSLSIPEGFPLKNLDEFDAFEKNKQNQDQLVSNDIQNFENKVVYL